MSSPSSLYASPREEELAGQPPSVLGKRNLTDRDHWESEATLEDHLVGKRQHAPSARTLEEEEEEDNPLFAAQHTERMDAEDQVSASEAAAAAEEREQEERKFQERPPLDEQQKQQQQPPPPLPPLQPLKKKVSILYPKENDWKTMYCDLTNQFVDGGEKEGEKDRQQPPSDEAKTGLFSRGLQRNQPPLPKGKKKYLKDSTTSRYTQQQQVMRQLGIVPLKATSSDIPWLTLTSASLALYRVEDLGVMYIELAKLSEHQEWLNLCLYLLVWIEQQPKDCQETFNALIESSAAVEGDGYCGREMKALIEWIKQRSQGSFPISTIKNGRWQTLHNPKHYNLLRFNMTKLSLSRIFVKLFSKMFSEVGFQSSCVVNSRHILEKRTAEKARLLKQLTTEEAAALPPPANENVRMMKMNSTTRTLSEKKLSGVLLDSIRQSAVTMANLSVHHHHQGEGEEPTQNLDPRSAVEKLSDVLDSANKQFNYTLCTGSIAPSQDDPKPLTDLLISDPDKNGYVRNSWLEIHELTHKEKTTTKDKVEIQCPIAGAVNGDLQNVDLLQNQVKFTLFPLRESIVPINELEGEPSFAYYQRHATVDRQLFESRKQVYKPDVIQIKPYADTLWTVEESQIQPSEPSNEIGMNKEEEENNKPTTRFAVKREVFEDNPTLINLMDYLPTKDQQELDRTGFLMTRSDTKIWPRENAQVRREKERKRSLFLVAGGGGGGEHDEEAMGQQQQDEYPPTFLQISSHALRRSKDPNLIGRECPFATQLWTPTAAAVARDDDLDNWKKVKNRRLSSQANATTNEEYMMYAEDAFDQEEGEEEDQRKKSLLGGAEGGSRRKGIALLDQECCLHKLFTAREKQGMAHLLLVNFFNNRGTLIWEPILAGSKWDDYDSLLVKTSFQGLVGDRMNLALHLLSSYMVGQCSVKLSESMLEVSSGKHKKTADAQVALAMAGQCFAN